MKTDKSLIATLLILAAALAGGRELAAQPDQPPPAAPDVGITDSPPAGTDNFIPDHLPAPAVPTDDQVAATVPSVFHDPLAPYGRWTESPAYGQVWVPQVSGDWRPYTTGHWAETDQGWAWIGDEPWAWATFHYGRWYYDTNLGWAWLPGAVWAPAWVAWRHGGGYLGWAPLPPRVGFTGAMGLDVATSAISPTFFTFVGERDFLAARVSPFIISTAHNRAIARVTTDVTRYAVVNNRVVTGGVSAQRIAQVTGHPVIPIKVATTASLGGGPAKGAFYQPPALGRVARSSHREFGAALPQQVAMQHRGSLSKSTASSPGSRLPGSGAHSPLPGSQGSRSTQHASQPRNQPVPSRQPQPSPQPRKAPSQMQSQPAKQQKPPL